MAVLSKDELFNKIKERVGDATDEETISFVEDVTDTFNELETRAIGDGTDWKSKYNELDETWKKKYRDRFFSNETSTDEVKEEQKENVISDGEKKDFNELFEEREG